MWLHNDWLQLLFEQGVVGVATYLPLILTLVRYMPCTPYLWGALLAYGTMMSFNYPVHTAIGALIAIYLLSEALTNERHKA